MTSFENHDVVFLLREINYKHKRDNTMQIDY